mmetsp:Transcript_6392/g.15387  ORF Transcript_6392/g.15387 Transcript_6392/m.15387 type:complete len:249 (-) Transcript_6392:201-947(-)
MRWDGGTSGQQLCYQNTERPNIRCGAVVELRAGLEIRRSPLQRTSCHLRWHVELGSHCRDWTLSVCVNAHAKVDQLHACACDDKVLWFYVPVDDPIIMQIFNCLQGIHHNRPRIDLFYVTHTRIRNVCQQVPVRSTFKNHADDAFVLKYTIQLNNVRVVEFRVNIYLPSKLMLSNWTQTLSEKHFQDDRNVCMFVYCFEHCTDFVISQQSKATEVLHHPAPSTSTYKARGTGWALINDTRLEAGTILS